jgi:hypothetical protein
MDTITHALNTVDQCDRTKSKRIDKWCIDQLGVSVDVSDYLSQRTVVQTRSVFGVIFSTDVRMTFRRLHVFLGCGSEGSEGVIDWLCPMGVSFGGWGCLRLG